MLDVRVEWTGDWPRRCKGRWIFEVDGKDYRYLLPFANDDGFDLPADTFGTYECWDMDSDGEREWFHYENGLDIEDWIDQNREWLMIISPHEEEWDDIFYAFQEHDWRFKECGGCVASKLKDVHRTEYLTIALNMDKDLMPYCTKQIPHNTMGIKGMHYIFEFPNGYSAAVIKTYGSYGWNMDLWEVDLYIDGELAYVEDFEWDVIGNLDDEGVNAILHKVMNYKEVIK